ncbi:SoxR reducing system RseC family protein [Candidatus Falkowbacteria bacterium]|uniref:Uncharacterized protein n=1 Tax=Candidatus Falkowbacteria bacterium CG10_big_fil_rev_8_21_14_0_10_37_18 TaxID=1974562 RepID=A0A2H0V8L2_9BACT|nr:SoxR reducing system RseC family protein [Candidatus Falkowbacteria bacterium]NCQ12765.1 SoxR reducing system RseC family protein [Candidatus Falkowbacteria bacterium]OIO06143.1 MAG: hypothetical protein AUJ26_01405 [Candidatus Falkowbacteria bacterium CG1_02_37_21]PIR95446.1 MAG: hypothetical protein COT93_02380 [Candidatus Falkowbacteria bacterium CG10_big_fil_rev_8_21_14_0_10_37_18]PIY79241.1 MAG: hypothetical protein COY81_03655 [Candidatus Pacebacteria bacterium CG_4_10_14_0_8_um_filter
MSKDLKNIRDKVMGEIRHGDLQMRPKIYFIAGSILVFISLVLSVLSSVFLFSLARFSWRSHGPMEQYHWDQLVAAFPWWAVIFAVVGLIVGIWLVRKYDFSYKINFKIIIVGFIAATIIAAYLVDIIGFNDLFYRRGYMNGLYGQNNGQGMMMNGGGKFNYYKSR